MQKRREKKKKTETSGVFSFVFWTLRSPPRVCFFFHYYCCCWSGEKKKIIIYSASQKRQEKIYIRSIVLFIYRSLINYYFQNEIQIYLFLFPTDP